MESEVLGEKVKRVLVLKSEFYFFIALFGMSTYCAMHTALAIEQTTCTIVSIFSLYFLLNKVIIRELYIHQESFIYREFPFIRLKSRQKSIFKVFKFSKSNDPKFKETLGLLNVSNSFLQISRDWNTTSDEIYR